MMLASTPNLLQMCSFDTTKSTKGASKLRRDLINSEIANLRDLLPLPSSTRQRLSQLQLMALVCVYIRKANYFQYAFRKQNELLHNQHQQHPHHPHHHLHHHHHHLLHQSPNTNFGFSKALSGFLMMMTQNGKLLYISDNAAEYLGHSMEDLLIHGDSVYDIIEKQDHQTIQNELMRSNNPLMMPDTRIFLCRMNVSRNSRRQMRFGDQKVVLVQGHFVSYLPLCSRNEPVFLATCTPVAMPETRECVVQGSTNVFTTIHSMDMKFIHLDSNAEFHLGYNKNQWKNLSWYDICHWDNLKEAQSKHRLIIQSEQERSCILLLRLQCNDSQWIWVHVVLQVKDNNENSQQPVIVCTNQVLSEKEAAVMQANGWLYQFYSLHSKMHYMQNQAAASSSSTTAGAASPSPSNVSVANSTTSSSNYPDQAQIVTRSYGGQFSNGSSTPSSASASAAFLASEPPSLAIHPSHPSTNTANNLSSSAYYSETTNNNGDGGTTGYQQYSSGSMVNAQYSPQAGTLPYQTAAAANQTNSPNTPTPTSQTEHRIKQEQQEPPVAAATTTTPTTRTKRSRANNNNNGLNDGAAPEPKRNKKKSHHHNSSTTTTTTTTTTVSMSTVTTATNTANTVATNHHHHQDHQLAPYESYRNMAANSWNPHHHHHHHHGTTNGVAYTTAASAGSVFGSAMSTTTADHHHLSTMITPTAAAAAAAAAYYGGASAAAYHHHSHSHHHHPHTTHPHQMAAAYTSHLNTSAHHHHPSATSSHHHAHHAHQTVKPFSFLEHDTANANYHHAHLHYNNTSSSSSSPSLTSGGANQTSLQLAHNAVHRNGQQPRNETTPASSSSSAFSSSTSSSTVSAPSALQSGNKPRQSSYDTTANSSHNDRRDLDKVRSPESITSATSDYGSMTSQSPPSLFEKPTAFSTLVSTSSSSTTTTNNNNNLQDSPSFDTYGTNHHHAHHSSPYASMKNGHQWGIQHHQQPAAITPDTTAASTIHDPLTNAASTFPGAFPRLSTFQFWSGYPSAAAATANSTNSDLVGVGHHPATQYHQHYHHHHDSRHHHPHLASTFPSVAVDSLLQHHQTYGGAGHHHSTAAAATAAGHQLFTPYHGVTTTTDCLTPASSNHNHHHHYLETSNQALVATPTSNEKANLVNGTPRSTTTSRSNHQAKNNNDGSTAVATKALESASSPPSKQAMNSIQARAL